MPKFQADKLAPAIPDNVYIPHKLKKGAFYSRVTALNAFSPSATGF